MLAFGKLWDLYNFAYGYTFLCAYNQMNLNVIGHMMKELKPDLFLTVIGF